MTPLTRNRCDHLALERAKLRLAVTENCRDGTARARDYLGVTVDKPPAESRRRRVADRALTCRHEASEDELGRHRKNAPLSAQ